jgi:hypothetical protein
MWQELFLSTLRDTGSLRKACAAAGVTRGYVLKYMEKETGEAEEFKLNYDHAIGDFNDSLEEAAYKRAVEGVEDPVYNKLGEVIGYKTLFSDTLLVKLMEGNMPEKYGKKLKLSSDVPFSVAVKQFAPAAQEPTV